jgi:hypothetical protein
MKTQSDKITGRQRQRDGGPQDSNMKIGYDFHAISLSLWSSFL